VYIGIRFRREVGMPRFSLMVLASVVFCLCAGCKLATVAGADKGTGVPDASFGLPDAPREYVNSEGGADRGPSADANCQNQPFTVTAPPPDLLIVLDRSGSMNESVEGYNCRFDPTNCVSKWTQVTAAINQVVSRTEKSIHWGLKLFGNDALCGITPGVTVAPDAKKAADIAAAIADPANLPASRTPTRAAELSAGDYLTGLAATDKNPKFVLLATDGEPNCVEGSEDTTIDDTMAAIDSVTKVRAMGFPTFVIGIATEGGDADMTLNAMATNGGYPLSGGTTQYYSVSTTDDLVTALNRIQVLTMGMCTYPLGTPDEHSDMTKVTVTVDGVSSPKDDPNGWHFEPGMTSITFTGITCDYLMKGTLKNVQVLYGCKVVVN
jgi:hypothetical protein